MSNKISSFIVTLKQNICIEDAEEIASALKLINGVVDVRPQPATVGDLISEVRVRIELEKKLLKVLREDSRI